jgi:DNA-binding beta-propeller fold protein YncE
VYIVCEGSYGSGNASLGLYIPATDSFYNDVYKAANAQALGDVFESMLRVGNYLFLLVNNSNNITVVADSDAHLITKISVPQPRYMLQVSASQAYISSMYSNKVYVLNLQQLALTDTISLPGLNPEGMLLYNNTAYISCWDTANHNFYQVNAATHGLVYTTTLNGFAPQELLLDADQKLWVLSGDAPLGKPAQLTRIDPDTHTILYTYYFPSGANPIKPVFNPTRDTLYYIEADFSGHTQYNGVFRMGIHDAALPTQAFIPAQSNQYFYALGISPLSGTIYIADPKGFVQKGLISVYRPDATLIKQFTCALGPGHFYFD